MMIWNLEKVGGECRECLVFGNLFIVYTAHAHVKAKIFKTDFSQEVNRVFCS